MMSSAEFAEGDLSITNNRLSVGDKSYVLSSVSSIARKRIDETPSWEPHKLYIFGWALLALVIFLRSIDKDGNIGWLVAPICGIAYSIRQKYKIKQSIRHVIILTSNAGEVEALSSYNEAYVERVHLALLQAIDKPRN